MEEPFKDSVFVKRQESYEKIFLKDILYVKAEGDYVTCFLQDEKITFRMSLCRLMQLLPAPVFLRVHRSYVIQLDKIEKINLQDSTVVIDKTIIPLNRASRKIIMEYITRIG